MKTMDVKTRIDIKNIAFATDRSPESYAALPWAAEFARYYGAKVWGFHVLPPNVYPVPPSLVLPTPDEDAKEAAKELGRQLAKHLAGVPQEVVIGHGETWSTFSSFIEKNSIDLIVMSTHGRTGLGKALLGSVAEMVFRQSPCPVLTVGPKAAFRLDQPVETKEILYATDFSPESRAAAGYAISMAREHQAHLVLLHVIEPPKARDGAGGGELVSNSMQLLRDLVPPEAELWCKPEQVVEYGSPADHILNMAARRHTHLIVLGVRKPGGSLGLATHFGRATAYQVVSQAKCPVLTVRG
jgi:nucleotide-binding universal stress UspA family protein